MMDACMHAQACATTEKISTTDARGAQTHTHTHTPSGAQTRARTHTHTHTPRASGRAAGLRRAELAVCEACLRVLGACALMASKHASQSARTRTRVRRQYDRHGPCEGGPRECARVHVGYACAGANERARRLNGERERERERVFMQEGDRAPVSTATHDGSWLVA